MIRHLRLLPLLVAITALSLLVSGPTPVSADHAWGNYHWERSANPLTLKVGDNVSTTWDPYLDEAISDWTASLVLNLTKIDGGTRARQCRATAGRIEVCSEKYGFNGWLGIAQIWASGDHITQATAKMNDSYFNTSTYNTPAWRRLVMCQEIAHDFGLNHQDETFDNPNLGTCMDYTNDPDGGPGGASSDDPSNEHPNGHDFVQLETIYSHLDATTTVGDPSGGPGRGRSSTAADEGPNNPADFGRPTGRRDNFGRDILLVKDLPDGRKLFTHVFWVLPGTPGAPGRP